MSKLFVCNLNFAATAQDMVNLFTEEGGVVEANVIKDKDTGKSKGYAFVTMDGEAAALRAINSFNGSEFMGRKIVVKEAEERRRQS